MSSLARGAKAFSAIVFITSVVHTAACDDGTHTYVGQFYREDRGCLGTPSAMDAIDGPEPGSCAAVCLAQRLLDGGRQIYVSTMCGPYPPDSDVSGKDPLCERALLALARGDTCASDGGSSHPIKDASSE